MPTLPGKVIFPATLLIKFCAPLDHLTDLFGCLSYNHLNHLFIAEMIPCHQGIFHMFLIAVGLISYCSDPSLRIAGIGLIHLSFGNHADGTVLCNFKRKTHSPDSRANYQKIILFIHEACSLIWKQI